MAALVIAGSDGAEILEPVDRTFDDITSLVFIWIKRRRTAAMAAARKAMLLGVLALRANASNTASLKQLARLAGAISFIDPQAWWPLFRTSRPGARNGNGIEHRTQLVDIGTLAGRHDQ